MSDSTVPITQAPRTAPDFIHELFWGQISSLLGEQLERYQPKMGTVSGTTGAYLLVLPDGSATPRKMAHVAGRRYRTGDRVVFGPVKGQPVVYGGVLTATGAAEAVVGMADLGADVTAKFASYDLVLTDHENRINSLGGLVTTAQGRADDAWTKADNARNRADNAFANAATAQTAANTANTAAINADAHAQTVYNLLVTPASNGQQALDRLQSNINLRMNTVCLKACGCNSCNCGTCASGVGQ